MSNVEKTTKGWALLGANEERINNVLLRIADKNDPIREPIISAAKIMLSPVRAEDVEDILDATLLNLCVETTYDPNDSGQIRDNYWRRFCRFDLEMTVPQWTSLSMIMELVSEISFEVLPVADRPDEAVTKAARSLKHGYDLHRPSAMYGL